jgi:(p)ppGpp synthase/HD superfamily hydrolase
MNDLVRRASRYATEAHSRINHRRKYSLEPYAVHLKDVARIVASVTTTGDARCRVAA